MIQKKQIKKLKHTFNHRTLAQKYPSLQKYIIISHKGETIINFKDQKALNELNHCIMDHYFSIQNFNLPLNSMIPALGCRLNYIQWVKQQVDQESFQVTKIYDVGTGFSGVFLFLAYRLYGWIGLGVDTSEEAIAHATQIANQNQVPCIFKVGNLFEFLENGMVTVCNPPFYGIGEEREFNRQILQQESFVEGGEVQFVKSMIASSNKDCLYTSMLGRKSSIKELGVTVTELQQGNNVRFALLWRKSQNAKQPIKDNKLK